MKNQTEVKNGLPTPAEIEAVRAKYYAWAYRKSEGKSASGN
jgi:hypothetical protein